MALRALDLQLLALTPAVGMDPDGPRACITENRRGDSGKGVAGRFFLKINQITLDELCAVWYL